MLCWDRSAQTYYCAQSKLENVLVLLDLYIQLLKKLVEEIKFWKK